MDKIIARVFGKLRFRVRWTMISNDTVKDYFERESLSCHHHNLLLEAITQARISYLKSRYINFGRKTCIEIITCIVMYCNIYKY